MRKYQIRARKHFIEKFNLGENATYLEVDKKVVEESNGKILFDVETKEGAAIFLTRLMYKYETS